MQSTVLFLVKLAILILLWLFIALTLRALKRDSATPSATVLAAGLTRPSPPTPTADGTSEIRPHSRNSS